MDAAIQGKLTIWLNGNYDQATKDEITRLQQDNPNELIESFYRNLEFGTGGLRGIMGVGTNRINKYTIGMATQGFANYLKRSFPRTEVAVSSRKPPLMYSPPME
jgi:phosphoglucomutase